MKAIKGRSHLTFYPHEGGTGFYYHKSPCGYAIGFPPIALAKCKDGVVRTIRLNQVADTFFSHPGRTTIQRKSVRGFVSECDNVLIFTAYKPEGFDAGSN